MFVLVAPDLEELYSQEKALGKNILIFKNFKILIINDFYEDNRSKTSGNA